MSLVFDKGKNKYLSEIEQFRPKNNFININIGKNYLKKKEIKNTHLYSEYETSSPFRNMNNNKKNAFLTTYQNYSNIMNNNREQNLNKKLMNNNKLKYNKSFEGNIINNDLIFSGNFDFIHDNIYSNNKIQGNKKFNNSVILNNKQNKVKNKNKSNKSVTRTINSHINMNGKKNNLDENFIIKKLDEKFKSLENNIIDKKYENDIDHDEIIISSKKKHFSYTTNNPKAKESNKVNQNNYNLKNIIGDLTLKNDFNKEEKFEQFFLEVFNNKKNLEFDENYLLNSSFENNRNDFNIMYTDNYGNNIPDDMLSLEIKLIIEKLLEIQKSYHKEIKLMINHYNNSQRLFNLLVERMKILQKKNFLLKKTKENGKIRGNIYNFIGVYNQNNQHEINKINKSELLLWHKLTGIREYNKQKIKELFEKAIFDKYNKISGKINNIENKIILNIMKKYNYKKEIRKEEKNKMSSSSPIQQNKIINKQNRNINSYYNTNNINKNKKHKKTSSCCCSTKPPKITKTANKKK